MENKKQTLKSKKIEMPFGVGSSHFGDDFLDFCEKQDKSRKQN